MPRPGSVSVGHARSCVVDRAPVLVLALGNRLLQDDGVGIELLFLLEPYAKSWGAAVELVDGGTRGLALLGEVQDRAAAVFLDAVKLGAEPGSVHVFRKGALLLMGGRASSTAHEGGAKEILAAAELLGATPDEVVVIGVEPEVIDTGIGLSGSVRAGLGKAVKCAVQLIEQLLEDRNVSRDTWKDC
jgi:hydrogenase maturation protease